MILMHKILFPKINQGQSHCKKSEVNLIMSPLLHFWNIFECHKKCNKMRIYVMCKTQIPCLCLMSLPESMVNLKGLRRLLLHTCTVKFHVFTEVVKG